MNYYPKSPRPPWEFQVPLSEEERKSIFGDFRAFMARITDRFQEFEKNNPKACLLAKNFAIRDGKSEESLDDICLDRPDPIPVHRVNGVGYPCPTFATGSYVPLWFLYFPKAIEALEEVGKLEEWRAVWAQKS